MFGNSFSEKGKKGALSRWSKVYNLENALIKPNKYNIHYKARICGYLAGDGKIFSKKGYNHYAISFYPDDISIVESYVTAFTKFYKKIPAVKPLHNYFYVNCNSKAIFHDLTSTTTFGVKKWRAPYKILYNKKAISEWLRGLFDSDGSVNVSKKTIRLQSINLTGLKDVKYFLSYLKINSFISKYNGNENRGVAYELYIPKYSEVYKFYKIVGFYHKLKKINLCLYVVIENKLNIGVVVQLG